MVRPKLIALDLDETLLDENSRLPERSRATLNRAIAEGIEIVVATGRAFVTIPEAIRRFPGIRYAITGNGAAIYDLRTERAIHRQTLPAGAAAQVLSRTAGEDISFEAFLSGAAYAQADYLEHLDGYMMNEAVQSYVRSTRIPVPDIRKFVLTHGDKLDSLAVIPRDLKSKQQLMRTLEQIDGVYITTSSVRLIEINHRDCTKKNGLEFLAAMLEIPQGDTAAFGNADNDAEMLGWAGIGVAVGNATERCLAAADHVTGSYQNEGAAQAMEEWFGI